MNRIEGYDCAVCGVNHKSPSECAINKKSSFKFQRTCRLLKVAGRCSGILFLIIFLAGYGIKAELAKTIMPLKDTISNIAFVLIWVWALCSILHLVLSGRKSES